MMMIYSAVKFLSLSLTSCKKIVVNLYHLVLCILTNLTHRAALEVFPLAHPLSKVFPIYTWTP